MTENCLKLNEDIGLKTVHLGEKIAQRIKQLGINKSEFARRLGILQQRVNTILEKDSIDTARLMQISQILEFNFFKLYVEEEPYIHAVSSNVITGDGNSTTFTSDKELQTQNEMLKEKVALLEGIIKDKECIIDLMKVTRQS